MFFFFFAFPFPRDLDTNDVSVTCASENFAIWWRTVVNNLGTRGPYYSHSGVRTQLLIVKQPKHRRKGIQSEHCQLSLLPHMRAFFYLYFTYAVVPLLMHRA